VSDGEGHHLATDVEAARLVAWVSRNPGSGVRTDLTAERAENAGNIRDVNPELKP